MVLNPGRRDTLSILLMTTFVGGAGWLGWTMIRAASSQDPQSQPLTIDLRTVPPGSQVVMSFRGAPLFVRHRTEHDIAWAVAGDRAALLDPQSDASRVQRAEWLVAIGSCTVDHCVPAIGEGDFGGWQCPCCGAQYDTSGRARTGPPNPKLKNLAVPTYRFDGANTLVLA